MNFLHAYFIRLDNLVILNLIFIKLYIVIYFSTSDSSLTGDIQLMPVTLGAV